LYFCWARLNKEIIGVTNIYGRAVDVTYVRTFANFDCCGFRRGNMGIYKIYLFSITSMGDQQASPY